MTEKTKKLLMHLEEGDLNSFKKLLLLMVSEKIEERLQEKRMMLSRCVLEVSDPDMAKAAAERIKADAEAQAIALDPYMAKEFFLFDITYRGHIITVKSLGTGIGKPLVSYIDGQRFEIFADKEIATRESKQAINRMIKRKIDRIQDLRKTDSQIKDEEIKRKEQEKLNKQIISKKEDAGSDK